ncbi:unnamed protein product, partial [Discosporangium mesarthrocarpum]
GGDGTGEGGDDGDSMISRRMPYCMAIMVLLAIVYVLSRTESPDCPVVHCPFDIGEYRRKSLAGSAPHIIEC